MVQQLWKPENQNAETGYVYNVRNSFVSRCGKVACIEVHLQLAFIELESYTYMCIYTYVYYICVKQFSVFTS